MAAWPKTCRAAASIVFAAGALAAASGTAAAAPGDLDSSFNGSGKLTFAPGGKQAEIDDIAIQPDGKLVLAGWVDQDGTGGEVDFLVVRLNSDGSFDQGFGSGGIATVNFSGKGMTSDTASGVAVQPDGKIVVGGSTHDSGGGGGTYMGIARLNSDGTPDASFNPAGYPHEGPAPVGQQEISLQSATNDLVLDASGRILLGGSVDSGGPFPDAFVLRLTRSGEADTSFNGGSAIIQFSWLAHANSVSRLALQPDGKIVAAGWGEYTDGDRAAAVARIVPGAVEDESFGGTDGEVYYDIAPNGQDSAEDLVIQPDGKIDVAGYGRADQVMVVSRLTADGNLEKSLSGQSSAFADFGGTDTASAIALQSNGKMILGGSTTHDMAIARFQANGLPDGTFGPDGKRTVSFPGGDSAAFAMALQADGKVVLAGFADKSAAVIRLQGDSAAGGGAPNPTARAQRCGGRRVTILGTNHRDRLKGTRRADVIAGLGGNDKIDGVAGNDIICGGAGNDSIKGGKGKDRLFGNAGKDNLSGGAGKDSLSGGAGADKLSGGAGADKLSGGAGNDKLAGGPGNDKLSGGPGKDRDSGGGGKDRCAGRDKKSSC